MDEDSVIVISNLFIIYRYSIQLLSFILSHTGMVVPNYSSLSNYDQMFALGVSMYGQMTAGSYCYIGPQGIVHGTTITVINAGMI